MNSPFNVLGEEGKPSITGEEHREQNQSGNLNDRIKNLVESSDLFLFMKGNPQAPQCGFSANICAVLNSLGVVYKTFNVLEDMEIRQGIKEYSNWPTIPQFYVKGQFVGGNDIMTELYENGELQKMLENYLPKT
jgi:monothiol glutaredoxin